MLNPSKKAHLLKVLEEMSDYVNGEDMDELESMDDGECEPMETENGGIPPMGGGGPQKVMAEVIKLKQRPRG